MTFDMRGQITTRATAPGNHAVFSGFPGAFVFLALCLISNYSRAQSPLSSDSLHSGSANFVTVRLQPHQDGSEMIVLLTDSSGKLIYLKKTAHCDENYNQRIDVPPEARPPYRVQARCRHQERLHTVVKETK